MVLFNLGTSFDTQDHIIQILRLSSRVISGTILELLTYHVSLTDISRQTKSNLSVSHNIAYKFLLPNIHIMTTQMHAKLTNNDKYSNVNNCITELRNWLSTNSLSISTAQNCITKPPTAYIYALKLQQIIQQYNIYAR